MTTILTVTCTATADLLEWCARQIRAGTLRALSIEMPEGCGQARISVVTDLMFEPPPGCTRVDEDEIETEPGIKHSALGGDHGSNDSDDDA